MGQITLDIANNRYPFTCRDEDEPHVRKLAEMVGEAVKKAQSSVGSTSETRGLMMAALLLADELNDARSGQPVAPPPAPADWSALEQIAAKLEEVASKLENGAV